MARPLLNSVRPEASMTIKELIAALLNTNLASNTLVTIGNGKVGAHIARVSEDSGNTGVIRLWGGDKLKDREVGYRL